MKTYKDIYEAAQQGALASSEIEINADYFKSYAKNAYDTEYLISEEAAHEMARLADLEDTYEDTQSRCNNLQGLNDMQDEEAGDALASIEMRVLEEMGLPQGYMYLDGNEGIGYSVLNGLNARAKDDVRDEFQSRVLRVLKAAGKK